MRKDIQIVIWLLVFLLFMVSCEDNLNKNEVSNGAIEVTSGKMNSRKKISIKSKQMIKLALSEQEETSSKEDSKQESTKNEEIPYTTEDMSGVFMATIALNMRTGPSIDYQLVGNLQPYEKAVASEQSTVNGGSWYKVTSDDMTGWVEASYLIPYEERD